ncbi:galactose mutarotase [Deinococcus detaillensis]|uniref:Aldose 1-epimerase n=1 Tax=Deinococcus detaillensis TaxID=2592048 RepID=A0A553V4J5_9DEIO|nr:aldose epimerase family protein [Deinococcus detaillensis]TSA87413.1 galactose mutarotase [Deinococcus detaillensis]
MTSQKTQPPAWQQTAWGQLPSAQPVSLYSLQNEFMQVWISNYGGRLVRVRIPDRQGHWGDVVLGHEELGPYLNHPQVTYYGALIGRFANRIKAGKFELDTQLYQIATNDDPNALHGGPNGFHTQVWTAEISGNRLKLSHVSPDGAEGFPGQLRVSATYTLSGHTLRLEWRAETDKATVLNLTHHPFWSLTGGADDVLDHELSVNADQFTPVSADAIPTGELVSVTGTPFDFRTPRRIGERIEQPDPQLEFVGGYDHNFVLNGEAGSLRHAATLHDPSSGRRLEVRTTEPGLQVYSGNFTDGSFVGFGNQPYGKRSSVCLEPQHFPDSPNQPSFPSTVQRPGEVFESVTEYQFSAE